MQILRNMRKLLLVCIVAVSLVIPLRATHPTAPYLPDPSVYEQVLIPIFTNRISSGAYGSQWSETVTVHNGSARPINILPNPPCAGDCFPPVTPGATTTLDLGFYNATSTVPAILVYVPRDVSASILITERIHELSRASMTWGTEIPVVRERDWRRASAVQIADLPLGDPAFRTMVRVYVAPTRACLAAECVFSVTLRLYEQSASPSVADRHVGSMTFRTGYFGHYASGHHPAYFALGDFSQFAPDISPTARYRIEIRPERDDLPFWAFASITNNETQHVTVATPR